MALVDHAPQVALRGQQAVTAARTIGTMFYEVRIKPQTEAETVYREVSQRIQKLKKRSLEERAQMCIYAMWLIRGDGSRPPGIDPLVAIRVEKMVEAERFQYRRAHPFKTRLGRIRA